MEYVFLIGSAQGIFLSFLVLNKRDKTVSDYFLALWLGFMAFHLLCAYLMITQAEIYFHPIFESIIEALPMLEGPFMLVYTSILISPKPRFKVWYLIHAIPYFFFLIYFLLNPFVGLKEIPATVEIMGEVRIIFNAFLGPFYAIASLVLLFKHKQSISHHFSYTEQIDLRWLGYVIGITCCIWLIVISSYFFSNFVPILAKFQGDRMIYTALSVAVFFLGYYGIKQPVIYDQSPQPQSPSPPILEPPQPSSRYAKSGLKDESKVYLDKLLQHMKVERPYLESKLTLPMLAEQLGLTTNILSQVINENLHQNFFEFVNNYRVNAVKKSLGDSAYDHLSLLGIAFECGFSSKSSFNRIFKEYTGQTPSEFKKTITKVAA